MNGARPLRVLIVAHYFPPHVGGIENVAAQQARALAAGGADVTVLTSAAPSTADTPRAGDGVRVIGIPVWNGLEHRLGVPFPVFAPHLAAAARRWVDWADVVHVHDSLYLSSWFAGMRAARTATPLVLTQHVAVVDHPSALVVSTQNLVYRTLGRRLFRASDTVFVVNGSVAGFAGHLRGDSTGIELLPNGVDATLYRPARSRDEQRALRARWGLPADRVLVLFVGRPVPKKGYDILLEARHGDYDLVFAGGSPAAARNAGAGEHHLGALTPDQLSEVYRACDVFALPSAAEGFPLTVQEAMASGLPVVTTDDPGYAPYGLDRARVALVPRDPALVRGVLRELAGDSARRAAMGNYSARYAADQFSWSAHALRLREVYDRALRRATAAPAGRRS